MGVRALLIRPALSYQGSSSQCKGKLPQAAKEAGQPLVAVTTSSGSRQQMEPALVPVFHRSGESVGAHRVVMGIPHWFGVVSF